MLDMHRSQQMTDIIHNCISYTGIESEVIGSPIYNRLHRVLQNSLVYLTFASNKVKRFEHSIGTMHLAGQIFFYSICNSDVETHTCFFNKLKEQISNWRVSVSESELNRFANKELQMHYNAKTINNAPVPTNPIYNSYTPGNIVIDEQFAYFVTFQAVRLAAMFHDLGHLPYSHILEHAMKNLYGRISEKTGDLKPQQKEFLEIMSPYMTATAQIHEKIGCILVKKIELSIQDGLKNAPKNNAEIFFFLISFHFAKRILNSDIDKRDDIFSDIHRIISSVIDADRLDYCSRDSYCSGTSEDKFSYLRIFSDFRLARITSEKLSPPPLFESSGMSEPSSNRTYYYFFCPSIKSLNSIEELLQRRWRIFTDINYHHRVHKHAILLEEIVAELGEMELEDDETCSIEAAIPLKIKSIWELINCFNTNQPIDYQAIQLDDSWMDTLLKTRYFDLYKTEYMSFSKYGNNLLWNRMDEIISTSKHYYSLFKRSADFRVFDEMLFASFKKLLIEDGYTEKKQLDIAKQIVNDIYAKFFAAKHMFFYNWLDKFYSACNNGTSSIKNIEDSLNQNLKTATHLHITDCLVRSCDYSMGVMSAKNPVFLYLADGQLVKLEEQKPDFDLYFKYERGLSPGFHLFYLPQYDTVRDTYYSCDHDDLISALVDKCCCCFASVL